MQRDIKKKSLIEGDLERLLGYASFSNTEKKILQYLTEKSLQNEQVSEYHLAIDVLGKSDDFDPAADSAVRVNVRKLRLKLKEIYLSDENSAFNVKFSIPKGRYAIEFSSDPKRILKKQFWNTAIIAFFLAVVIIFIALLYFNAQKTGGSVKDSMQESILPSDDPVWKEFAGNGESTIIVLGDLYFMRMFENDNEDLYYVRKKEVNSPEDQYTLADERLRKYDLTFTPSNITESVLRLYEQIKTRENKVRVVLASEFSLDEIAENNVLYLGDIQAIRDLRKILKQLGTRLIKNGHELVFSETNDTIILSITESQFMDIHSIVLKHKLDNGKVCMFMMADNRLGIEVAVHNLTSPEGLDDVYSRSNIETNFSFYFNLVYLVKGVDSSPINSKIIYFKQQ